jgi:hypothetical protein
VPASAGKGRRFQTGVIVVVVVVTYVARAPRGDRVVALQIENAEVRERTNASSSEFRNKAPQRSIPEPCHRLRSTPMR